jgi:small conductance mechanosensitive channel
VKFDNAGGTVEEISLRKTTLRDLDGTVHHIPHERKYRISKDFSRINLDIGVDTDLI